VLGRVTLVTGKEEFLNERTVSRRAPRSAHDAEAEISEPAAAT
jgi:DNA polymerase-3 subunit delta